jgi:hypothetical protein
VAFGVPRKVDIDALVTLDPDHRAVAPAYLTQQDAPGFSGHGFDEIAGQAVDGIEVHVNHEAAVVRLPVEVLRVY